MSGTLFVVSTPIGNLEDLSARAREVLTQCATVACEDTRRTGRLLAAIGKSARLVSVHEHNEAQRLPRLLAALAQGDSIALVSDAGTPLLSDPGFLLVRAAVRQGTTVISVPGPSAILAALVSSGLPPHPFTFAGFPPPKTGKRRRFFQRFADLGHTLVVFESPHRLRASLDDALSVLGDRQASLSRELTKLHEETLRGCLSEIASRIGERPTLKGEYTLVVGGDPAPGTD